MNPQGVSFRSVPAAALLIGALGLLVQGCVARGEPERQGPRAGHAAAVPVKTALVQVRTLPVTVEAMGTVEPRSVVSVHSQVTGQLATVAFEEGAEVKQGDLLFTIDPRPADVQLEQTRAVLARDRTQAASARTTATRYADLLKRGLVPPEQADQAEAQAVALDAAVRADEATVKNAELQKDYTIIRAPVSGRTGALLVHAGNLVRDNDTMPLVVINQIAPIYVGFACRRAADRGPRPARQGELAWRRRSGGERGGSRTARSRSSTTPSTRRPARSGSRRRFPNADRRLWPGAVRRRHAAAVDRDPHAMVVPTAAVQPARRATTSSWSRPDRTVEMRAR